MGKERKKKRWVAAVIIVAICLSILYFAGGIVAVPLVEGAIYSRRGIDPATLLSSPYLVSKIRSDYPNLEKREVHQFRSGSNTLTGYLYDVEEEKGLFLCAHGLSGCADDDDAQYQSYLVGLGYDVFAIDLTGSGLSQGNGTGSLWQSAYDVASAYEFLNKHSLMKDRFFMIGHSWGAFGIAASLSLGVKSSGIITFSAYDNPADMEYSFALSHAGFPVTLTTPAFYLAQFLLHDKDSRLSASEAIKKSSTSALVIQGSEDETVRLDSISLYSKAKDFPNVTPLLLEGYGHEGPWRSISANEYLNGFALPFYREHEGEAKSGKEKEIRSQIDIERSSALSPVVTSAIEEFLSRN